ncbi:MAG: AraC family transcriptional regulator [Lachnospiraceae bacterium]|nr:AraC family transcriptional regulator [Lachnospiraceae bacterium]
MKYLDYRERREQGTFTFPIAFYHQTSYSPRYYMTYHWHLHYEIIHILSGAFQLTLDNLTRTYHAGDVVLVTGGTLHGGSPVDHSCVYDCILFDLEFLLKDNQACAKTIQDIRDHKILVHTLLSQRCNLVSPIIEGLTDALSRRETGYEFLTQGYLYQLLGVILSEHLYEENKSDAVAAERLNSMKSVLAYISDNYSGNISLDSLARIAGMNSKYFCCCFRSVTGRTPIDYLNYFRIECACEMLSTKNLSIKETAISCGFNDESYFIRTFHKYKGTTPKKFLKAEFS